MVRSFILIFYSLTFLNLAVLGQSFTDEQKLQGYALFGDQLTFIFDELSYQVQPEKVFVTGAFRDWNASTDDPDWFLKKTGEFWLLSLDNTDHAFLQPNTPFKFRINDGEWLEPPATAINKKGGNLVFLPNALRPGLKAELKSESLIWAEVKGERPLTPDAYLITDAKGNQIKVAAVLPNGAATTLIIPENPLDKKRVYFLEMPAQGFKAHCSFDGWFRETYSNKALGANIEGDKTTIRIFSPRATEVNVYLYKGKDDDEPYKKATMAQDKDGVWEIEFPQDLHGVYYDFTVHGFDEPGNHFYETNPIHINDPYTRVSDDTWGKGRIWRKTKPAKPLKNGIPQNGRCDRL